MISGDWSSDVCSSDLIVLASLDGEFTVKTLAKNKNGSPRLLPANEAFSPIEVLDGVQFQIWGVVTGAVRKFK